MRKIDLTGQVFGEWTVIEYDKDKKWICKCSCGEVRSINGYDLRAGKSVSCGHGKNKKVDLTGQMFGYWRVLKFKGNRMWECECTACGTVRDVAYSNLVNGLSKSCGCVNRVKDDIIGKTFGELTVLEKTADTKYLCQCSCGRLVEIYRSNLLRESGASRSCGCKFYEHGAYTRMLNGTTAYREDWQIKALKSKENLESFLSNLGYKITIISLAKMLNMSESETRLKIEKYNLRDYIVYNDMSSEQEKEIANIIRGIYSGEVILRDRSVLAGEELDIYIPDKKIAIEFNGNYWHNEDRKDRMYHRNKTAKCIHKGIQLIHIFEYEWDNEDKKERIINYLKSLLSSNKTKVYARNIDIKVVESAEINKLYNKYHVQGGMASAINIGMYYNGELIGGISFSKPRYDKEYQYELTRLCYKSNIIPVGCSEKAFKYFITEYNPNSIVSYCDAAKFRGNTYIKLGFEAIKLSEPNYIWWRHDDIMTRYQAQKHKLLEAGYGIYGDSESEIMHNLGYSRIFDCGNGKFGWNRMKSDT